MLFDDDIIIYEAMTVDVGFLCEVRYLARGAAVGIPSFRSVLIPIPICKNDYIGYNLHFA